MTKLLESVDVIRLSNFFHFFLYTNSDRKFGDQKANEKHQFDGFENTDIRYFYMYDINGYIPEQRSRVRTTEHTIVKRIFKKNEQNIDKY